MAGKSLSTRGLASPRAKEEEANSQRGGRKGGGAQRQTCQTIAPGGGLHPAQPPPTAMRSPTHQHLYRIHEVLERL